MSSFLSEHPLGNRPQDFVYKAQVYSSVLDINKFFETYIIITDDVQWLEISEKSSQIEMDGKWTRPLNPLDKVEKTKNWFDKRTTTDT